MLYRNLVEVEVDTLMVKVKSVSKISVFLHTVVLNNYETMADAVWKSDWTGRL